MFVLVYLFECQIDVHAKLVQCVYIVSLIFNFYFIIYDFFVWPRAVMQFNITPVNNHLSYEHNLISIFDRHFRKSPSRTFLCPVNKNEEGHAWYITLSTVSDTTVVYDIVLILCITSLVSLNSVDERNNRSDSFFLIIHSSFLEISFTHFYISFRWPL